MTPTPRTDAHESQMESEDFDVELAKTYTFARTLERELLELLERLADRTHSHTLASMRDVQTIQRQAVEIDRLKSLLKPNQH